MALNLNAEPNGQGYGLLPGRTDYWIVGIDNFRRVFSIWIAPIYQTQHDQNFEVIDVAYQWSADGGYAITWGVRNNSATSGEFGSDYQIYISWSDAF